MFSLSWDKLNYLGITIHIPEKREKNKKMKTGGSANKEVGNAINQLPSPFIKLK
jgi:hypothetical protein